jgi:hypothetical protein
MKTKSLISSLNSSNIDEYEKILTKAGISYERGMDFPHHPKDHVLKVSPEDYKAGMRALYPNRGTRKMSETRGYDYIVTDKRNIEAGKKITKEYSIYLSRVGFLAGCCIDYQTEEGARNAAERCNNRAGDSIYKAVKISE